MATSMYSLSAETGSVKYGLSSEAWWDDVQSVKGDNPVQERLPCSTAETRPTRPRERTPVLAHREGKSPNGHIPVSTRASAEERLNTHRSVKHRVAVNRDATMKCHAESRWREGKSTCSPKRSI